jgi:hypothetical protein
VTFTFSPFEISKVASDRRNVCHALVAKPLSLPCAAAAAELTPWIEWRPALGTLWDRGTPMAFHGLLCAVLH